MRFKGRYRPGHMNGTEAAYARYLEDLKANGEVSGYWFEPMKLKLADKTTYSPDFMVMLPDGSLELHEVKGFMRDDANVKLKVAADKYPFTFKLVRLIKRVWHIKEV